MKRFPVVPALCLGTVCLVLALPPAWSQTPPIGFDGSNNGLSDIWEILHGTTGLTSGGDQDKDGWTNYDESQAGTDPLDAASFPYLTNHASTPGLTGLEWPAQGGKLYTLQFKPNLEAASWVDVPGGSFVAEETALESLDVVNQGAADGFYRLGVVNKDTDSDGLTDWEEILLGYNPKIAKSQRTSQNDLQKFSGGFNTPTVVCAALYDADCWERWPDPGVFVIRRLDGVPATTGDQISTAPVTINFTITGTATRDVDYTLGFAGDSVTFAPGQREYFIKVTPLQDTDHGEPTETVIFTINASTNNPVLYTLAASPAVVTQTVSIVNQTLTSGPSPEEAARFLIQASYGPNQDGPAGATTEYQRPGQSASEDDQIPENVEEVMTIGFETWIDQQLDRPIGLLLPSVQWQSENTGSQGIYNLRWKNALWGRMMEMRKLRPAKLNAEPAGTQPPQQDPDPLRQRMAYALSQIFVVSLRQENIGPNQLGLTDYYDMLITHGLGNYRALMEDVTLHAAMGLYLSYAGNKKAAGAHHPDENYAREIMQLFTIGLWELNQDGTRKLDANLQPIPTYDNTDITQFARVFTGICFADGFDEGTPQADDLVPSMIGYNQYHEMGEKVLLNGVVIPAANPPYAASKTLDDMDVALDCLFNHPNIGPFIGRQLIQRFVTSNPSPAYVGRVAAAFNNNGGGVRGDLGAVIKAILLDPEARSSAALSDPNFGKLKEPFLKTANYLRAFNAVGEIDSFYYMDGFYEFVAQDPLNAPSVFNFYLPSYMPPGELAAAGLVAPEFQILNATTASKAINYYRGDNSNARAFGGVSPAGAGGASSTTTLNLNQEKDLLATDFGDYITTAQAGLKDPDAFLRRIDLSLTGGTLEPETIQIIREAMQRYQFGSTYQWVKARLNTGLYLTMSSPEMAVLR